MEHPTQFRRYRGLVRVDIDALDFAHGTVHRPISERNVDRLRQVFTLEGCRRYTEKNYITAVVDLPTLERALLDFDLQLDGLLQRCAPQDIPKLSCAKLRCLHGLHRVSAALQHLDENDRWWIVKLFTDDLPEPDSVKISEDYLNEQPYSDGEIFWKIRHYHQSGDDRVEKKWWTRLSPTKRKDLTQLLKDERYAQAFDALLEWPGLWAPIKLGTLHRLSTLKCDEELLRHLAHVRSVWQGILDGVEHSPHSVDSRTVSAVQALAPSHSSSDKASIEDAISEGSIFAGVRDEDLRSRVFRNFCSVPGLVPSLHTFFENLKYLEPCCTVLKRLLNPGNKKTIWRGLTGCYYRPDQPVAECAEDDRRQHSPTDLATDRSLAYKQLWLFAMRHFPEMTAVAPRKELGKGKPGVKQSSPILWQRFGDLAVSLGFRTRQALDLQREDPSKALAVQLAHSIDSATAADDVLVTRLASLVRQIRARHKTPSVFGFAFGSDARDTPVDRSYGRPLEDSHNADRSALFLPVLWRDYGPPSTYITSLMAKRDMFTGFFGQEDVRIDLSAVVSTRVHHGSLNLDDLSGDEESRIPALESELRSLRQELDASKSSSQVEAELTRSLLGRESRLRAQLEQEKSGLHSELGDLRAELASTRQERERLAQNLEQRGEAAPDDGEIVREHFRMEADFAALEENFQRILAERETFLLVRDEALRLSLTERFCSKKSEVS
ncbi:hypothetical protein LTR50_007666 [Elasticomyces elasticus]|nr:hypothetical protein LTR50_007666 [Elasticomyces elasticus]